MNPLQSLIEHIDQQRRFINGGRTSYTTRKLAASALVEDNGRYIAQWSEFGERR